VKIYHTDFWGTRINKYKRSIEGELRGVNWKVLLPVSPQYLFVSQNVELRGTYSKGVSLNEIFNKNSLAIVSGNDNLFIDFNEKDLIKKMKLAFPSDKIEKDKIKSISYRTFDTRYIYYDNKYIERPRAAIMKNLFYSNIALNSAKYGRQLGSYNYFVTKNITSKDLTSSIDSVNTFPLYLILSDSSREINFSTYFKKVIAPSINELTKEHILGYIYSILYSPAYRKKYTEFLKIDFPRIPFTEDKAVFKQLSELGNQLIQVHLVEKRTDYPYGDFIGKGTNIVEKPNYVTHENVGRLYINKTQYFNNVPQDIYNFYIGGYQVVDKYLKDRKGRELNLSDIENIKATVGALAFTIEQMEKIDTLTKNWI
jgi:predicted helicase